MNRSFATLALCFLLLAPCPALAATGGPDSYGYTFTDSSSGGVSYQWIDITATGEAVVTGGDDTSTFDPTVGSDGPIELGFPFTFYGVTHTELTAAANGYLSTINDKGGDATNDCPIPNTPDDGGGARIYPIHDDLTLVGGGDIYYQYLHASPHPHSPCGVSIFTWNGAIEKNSGSKISFQALLFDNGDILFQYGNNSATSTDGLTIGIQNLAASIGLSHTCDLGSENVPSDFAILFEPPSIIVTTNADEFDIPATNGSGLVSLREAINEIPSGGKILFDPSVSGLTLDITTGNPTNLITINKPMAIDASSLAVPFQISGALASPVMEVDGTTVTLTGLVIRDGQASQFEASGIEMDNSPTLKCCRVDFLFNLPAPSPFSGGSAVRASDGRFSAVHCRFRGNAAESGGAISWAGSSGGPCEIRHCEFACNRATGSPGGGAISFIPSGAELIIEDSSFFDNEAQAGPGGALRVRSLDFVLRQCMISNNRAAGIGGGVSSFTNTSSFVMEHCTVVENQSGAGVAGVQVSFNVPFSFGHSVVAANWRNDGTLDNFDVPATSTSLGYNLTDGTEAVYTGTGDQQNTDPLLGPLGPYGGNFTMTHLPLVSSPLIDGGDSGIATAPAADQRGLPRIANGDNTGAAIIDIGAVEAGDFILVDTTANENDSPATAGSGFVSLREAIRDATSGQHIRFDPSLSGAEFPVTAPAAGLQNASGATSLHIDASNLAEPPVIDAASNRILYVPSGVDQTVSMHHIELTGASISGSGGAINTSSALTLDRCRVADNKSIANPGGGGVLLSGSHGAIHGCQFIENTAARGSAFTGGNPMYLRITGSWFHQNRSTFSDSTLETQGFLLVDGCTFSRNRNQTDGGCVTRREDGCLIVCSSTFSMNNKCLGAIRNDAYAFPAEVSHSTFFGNYSANNSTLGVAIANPSSSNPVTLRFNLFSRNILQQKLQGFDSTGSHFVSGGYNLSDENDDAFDHPTDLNVLNPTLDDTDFKLAVLAWNGGPVPTHHPLVGSLAIDGDAQSPATFSLAPPFDARGFERSQDGDLDTQGRIDIGAVEAVEPIFVNTSVDENTANATTSLREAIAAASDPGRILFIPSLAGDTIDLDPAGGGQNTTLAVDKTLVIDATNLINHGITLAGPSASRIMNFSSGGDDLALHGVSFTDGKGSAGGAIKVQDNRLTITHSALYRNTPSGGGGALLVNNSDVLLENVTLAENTSIVGGSAGGAIQASNGSHLTLRHCTVVDNIATSAGAGIALFGGDSSATFYATILAENFRTNGTLANIFLSGFPETTSEDFNLTDDSGGSVFTAFNDITNTVPVVSTIPGLDLHPGGLALTLPPMAGSPIVDAGPPSYFASPLTPPGTDARGFPRPVCGRIDIGAYELGGTLNGMVGNDFLDADGLDTYWEVFYGFDLLTDESNFDTDGDGLTTLEEMFAQTKPNDATSRFFIRQFLDNVAADLLTWQALPGLTYTIYVSKDLGLTDPWIPIGTVKSYGFGASFNIPNAYLTPPAAFFRVRAE